MTSMREDETFFIPDVIVNYWRSQAGSAAKQYVVEQGLVVNGYDGRYSPIKVTMNQWCNIIEKSMQAPDIGNRYVDLFATPALVGHPLFKPVQHLDTVYDAMAYLASHLGVMSPVPLSLEDDGTAWVLKADAGGFSDPVRQFTSLRFLMHWEIIRHSSINANLPREMELWPLPNKWDYFLAKLPVAPQTGSVHYLKITYQDAKTPMMYPHPEHARSLTDYVTQIFLGATGPKYIQDAVRDVVAENLFCCSYTLENVARELRLSPRTLQRRLAVAGVSFSAIVDSVRYEACERMIEEGKLSKAQIAHTMVLVTPIHYIV